MIIYMNNQCFWFMYRSCALYFQFPNEHANNNCVLTWKYDDMLCLFLFSILLWHIVCFVLKFIFICIWQAGFRTCPLTVRADGNLWSTVFAHRIVCYAGAKVFTSQAENTFRYKMVYLKCQHVLGVQSSHPFAINKTNLMVVNKMSSTSNRRLSDFCIQQAHDVHIHGTMVLRMSPLV